MIRVNLNGRLGVFNWKGMKSAIWACLALGLGVSSCVLQGGDLVCSNDESEAGHLYKGNEVYTACVMNGEMAVSCHYNDCGECLNGDKKIENERYLLCANGVWQSKGICTDGEIQCVNDNGGFNKFVCEGEEWIGKGQCGLICKDEDDGAGVIKLEETHDMIDECRDMDDVSVSCHGRVCGECLNGEHKCVKENGNYINFSCIKGAWERDGECDVECRDNDVKEGKILMDGKEFDECLEGDNKVSCRDNRCGVCLNGKVKCEEHKKYECSHGEWNETGKCDCSEEGVIDEERKVICSDYNWVKCNNQNIGTIVGSSACIDGNWHRCGGSDYGDGSVTSDNVWLCKNGEWLICELDGEVVDSFACSLIDNRMQWTECRADMHGRTVYNDKLLCIERDWKDCDGDNGEFCVDINVFFLKSVLQRCMDDRWVGANCVDSGCSACSSF